MKQTKSTDINDGRDGMFLTLCSELIAAHSHFYHTSAQQCWCVILLVTLQYCIETT